MGADIHVYMEYKNENSEWEYLYIQDQNGDKVDWYDRNYTLFGLLADVRAQFDCPYTNSYRGIPSDASAEVTEQYEEYADIWHTPTWYSMSELQLISAWIENYKNKIENKFNILNAQNKISLDDINELNYELEEIADMQDAIDNFINFCSLIANINFKQFNELRVIIWFDN